MDTENDLLSAPPNEEEMFATLKQVLNQKGPGPNGMSALFYRHYWIITKSEVIKTMQKFFQNGKLLKQMNNTKLLPS